MRFILTALIAMLFLPGIFLAVLRVEADLHAENSQKFLPKNEIKSNSFPIRPETIEELVKTSDVVAYAAVLSVDKQLKPGISSRMKPGMRQVFPEQHVDATLLWVIKGGPCLEGRTVHVIKEKSAYFLQPGQKRILYLKRKDDRFHTVDKFGGEYRLASAWCDIKNLDPGMTSGGVMASFEAADASVCDRIAVLRGRHPTSLRKDSADWKDALVETEKVFRFNTCEIPLPKGTYTVLVALGGALRSYTRPVNGHYACVRVDKERWWEPLYFLGSFPIKTR
jgi:hypothetical protein